MHQEGGRKPWNSINFICAHDGFTLADLVMYNHKHNLANGEDNKDGESHNNRWNCRQVILFLYHLFYFLFIYMRMKKNGCIIFNNCHIIRVYV